MIQELYQGLSKMEERVDALETILLDREKKGKTG
jgi:phage shock protein B